MCVWLALSWLLVGYPYGGYICCGCLMVVFAAAAPRAEWAGCLVRAQIKLTISGFWFQWLAIFSPQTAKHTQWESLLTL